MINKVMETTWFLTRECKVGCVDCTIREKKYGRILTAKENFESICWWLDNWGGIIIFFGGEILEYPYLKELVILLKREGLLERMAFLTSGVDHNTYYKVEDLVNWGSKNISLSIDTLVPVGMGGIDEKSIRAVELVERYKHLDIDLHITITLNKQSLRSDMWKPLLDYLVESNVWIQLTGISSIYPTDDTDFYPPPERIASYLITEEDRPYLLKLVEYVKTLYKEYSRFFSPVELLDWYWLEVVPKGGVPCPYEPLIPCVDADGKMRLCLSRRGVLLPELSVLDRFTREEFLSRWKKERETYSTCRCAWDCIWIAKWAVDHGEDLLAFASHYRVTGGK